VDAAQLKRIPLFSDASDEELKQVAAFAQDKEVPEGEVVLEEGGFSRAAERRRGLRCRRRALSGDG
jgi:hypothetical protein